MIILYSILILLAVFILITLIRAVFFKAPPVKKEEFPEESVNEKRAAENLSEAIKIKTISHEDESLTEWNEFERFHAFLRNAYPKIHSTLELT